MTLSEYLALGAMVSGVLGLAGMALAGVLLAAQWWKDRRQ
jgi:hypothetical protein